MNQPITSSQAKFLALGILSPNKAETLQQEVTEREVNERSAGVKQVVKKDKRRLGQGLKSLGMVLLLGVFLAACSTKTPEDIEAQAARLALPHHPPGTSKIHWLDPELYWELQKISIKNGGTGSPSEVDSLYDSRH